MMTAGLELLLLADWELVVFDETGPMTTDDGLEVLVDDGVLVGGDEIGPMATNVLVAAEPDDWRSTTTAL